MVKKSEPVEIDGVRYVLESHHIEETTELISKQKALKNNIRDQRKSGFEDDHIDMPCTHPGHNPPMHLVIPQGKIYRHICPSCGAERVLRNKITF